MPDFNEENVKQVCKIFEEIKELCVQLSKLGGSLSPRENSLVGSMVCSITSPYGLGEFDAFIGDTFSIEAGLNRLMSKMRAHQQQQTMRRREPGIMPAQSGKMSN